MLRVYRQPEENEQIVVGVDTAAGGNDYCAAQFLSIDRQDVPIVYHAKALASDMTPELVEVLIKLKSLTGVKPIIAYERNNGGIFELERLARMDLDDQFTLYEEQTHQASIRGMQPAKRLGFTTTANSKKSILGALKNAIDNRLLLIYDRPTINELFSFIVEQTKTSWRSIAETGKHDDLIMALAIALQISLDSAYSTTPIKSQVIQPMHAQEYNRKQMVNNQKQDLTIDDIIRHSLQAQDQGYRDWKYL